MAEFHVTFRPNPVNAWFYRLFAVPFVRIDSKTHQCSWASTFTLEVQPGEYVVETYVRYKHGNRDRALGEGIFRVPAGGEVSIQAANTWANQSVFMPHLVTDEDSSPPRGLAVR